jgi:hypothetical protein
MARNIHLFVALLSFQSFVFVGKAIIATKEVLLWNLVEEYRLCGFEGCALEVFEFAENEWANQTQFSSRTSYLGHIPMMRCPIASMLMNVD